VKRLLRQKEAAEYCGLSIAAFERAITAGTIPMPIRLENNERWCVKALDKAIDRLSGAEPVPEYEREFENRYGPQAA
jgi:predicted DNA-binding transcriptional regulator AlpA